MAGRIALIFTLLLAATAANAAEPALSLPYTRRVPLERTCARDLARFCPELANSGQQRNQVICLRPYRLDLDRPCRRVVEAALH